MKKSILASFFIFALSVTFAFAQTDGTETTRHEVRPLKREAIKEIIQQKRSDLQEEVQTKRTEVRAQFEEKRTAQRIRLQEKAQERVKAALGKIFDRFDAVIVRFEGFLTRIESRIIKMEERDIDTTTARNLFDIAQTKVNDSATLIIALNTELQATVEGESSKEVLRESITQIKESLKTAQSALKDVVVEIKSSDKVDEETEE